MNPVHLLNTPIVLHGQPSFQRPTANGPLPVEEEDVNRYSLDVAFHGKHKFQAPGLETKPVSIPPPIATALDTANSLLVCIE